MRRYSGLLACAAALLAASQGHAGTLTCHFTEPFITTTFDSAKSILIVEEAHDTDPVTGKPIQKITTGAKLVRDDKWEGVAKMRIIANGESLVEIRLQQGSDGMSDMTYPFEGVTSGRVGGCETDKAPAFDDYEVWTDLGVEF